MARDVTTIELKRTTRNRLAAQGQKDDTFDVIINQILDQVEGTH